MLHIFKLYIFVRRRTVLMVYTLAIHKDAIITSDEVLDDMAKI